MDWKKMQIESSAVNAIQEAAEKVLVDELHSMLLPSIPVGDPTKLLTYRSGEPRSQQRTACHCSKGRHGIRSSDATDDA